ncbi:hypothetical protein ACPB9J_33350 [Streptomyces lavendulocolor]|uniref:hypothetical protein n=1 Tax=Streptomyces lavendulocolor TaxID=67316 RepID=UPI003C2F3BF8
MSAAEPSIPEPVQGPVGSVIHLAQYPSARSRAGVRRTEPPAGGEGYDVSPPRRLVETVQAIFRRRRQSLADPDTAAAYDTTLEAVQLMVRGAAATGQLDEEQHALLRDILDDMRGIPEAV